MKNTILAICLIFLSGCASLLPSERQTTKPYFESFESAKQKYDVVQLDKTTLSEVKQLGFDPEKNQNVTMYSYGEIARTLLTINQSYQGTFDLVDKCVSAKDRCYGYELFYIESNQERTGNFFLDFAGFVKETETKGWTFRVSYIFIDDKVVFKAYSGIPHKYDYVKKVTPLGPFQGAGESLLSNGAKNGINDLKQRW